MSLSPENQALVGRFYKDGAPDAECSGVAFDRLGRLLDAARAEGPTQHDVVQEPTGGGKT